RVRFGKQPVRVAAACSRLSGCRAHDDRRPRLDQRHLSQRQPADRRGTDHQGRPSAYGRPLVRGRVGTAHAAFTAQPAVRWGAATDVGLVRVGNEDAYVVEPMVFGVADGMGGHQAGEVASEIAARIMRDRLGTGATNVGVVVASVVEANAAIYPEAHAIVDHHGMGTTLTALVVLRAV